MARRLRQEGHFYLAGFEISLVVIAQIPEAIVQREHPGCAGADVRTKLGLHNAWQLDVERKILIEPKVLLSRIRRVDHEAPHAIERHSACRAHGCRKEHEDHNSQKNS